MKRLFRNKKAVSPVVATLLLVALTVSAGAVIYFLVIPLLNDKSDITFGISEVSDFKDYDRDGTIDAVKVNVVIVTTNGIGFANMSLFRYEITTDDAQTFNWIYTKAGVTLISDGGNGDVVISAWSETGELTEGQYYTIRVYYGSTEENLRFQAGIPTTGSLVTVNVIDLDSDPVPGAEVRFYYSSGAFTGKPVEVTNALGRVQIALKVGEYQARVRYLGRDYWSDTFNHPQVSTVTVQVGAGGPIMTVHVQSDAGGIPGLTVFSFDSLGRYKGDYAITNDDGDAFLTIDPGMYVFKVFYLGFNYSSPLVDYPTTNLTTISIGGGTVYARVMDTDDVGQANFRVYLFSSTGSYLGISRRTNDTGYAAFTLSSGAYKFRVDYGGARSWSEVFGAADGAIIPIYIGGKVYAHVVYGDNIPISNVRVYLFTASGSYTGRSGRTNETGYVLFSPVQKETYFKFRVDYAAAREWSDEFTGENASLVVTINVGAEAYAHVVYGEDIPLYNVRVYLFTTSGSYSGLSARTNETGYARFNGVPKSSESKFRVDYAAARYWSETFNGTISPLVVDINIGGTVYAHVTYGPDDLALSNVRVYLFTASGSYSGISARTNNSGYAEFNGVIRNVDFKFRVDYAAGRYWSDTFNGSVDGFVVDINIGGIVYAHVTYGPDNDPLNNVRVYLFTASGSYSGISARTNETGYAQFNGVLSTSNYKFRVDYVAARYWSTTFNGSLPVYVHDMNIGGIVYAHIIYGADNDSLNNVRVYLFTVTGSYSGLSIRTNSTGYAQFNGVIESTWFKFRVDYAGGRFWSTNFNGSLPEYVKDVKIGNRILCFVNDGGTPIIDRQVMLYTATGSYSGLSVNTNATGYAQFNGVLSTTNYRFRVSHDSTYYWSDYFNGSVDMLIMPIDVSIGPHIFSEPPQFEPIHVLVPSRLERAFC